jgi:hypothetical protein
VIESVLHEPTKETWEKIKAEDPKYAQLAISWRLEAAKERRRMFVIEGAGPEDRKLQTNGEGCLTTATAILERMIYARVNGHLIKRQCKPYRHYNELLGEFKNKVVKAIGRTITPVTAEEFVCMYKGRKRTIYEGYIDEYLSTGVQKIHSVFKTFSKIEKVPPNKCPRTIQPRSPIFNIGLGRYLKPHEKKIFKGIAKLFKQRYVVYKGLNANAAADSMKYEWDRFADPVAVGIDASRFDASTDRGMLEWEHSMYNMLFKDKELSRILKMQLDNRGKAYCTDGVIKYKVNGGRGSGDMNTSLGNSIIMCGMIWSWLKICGVDAKLINNGDDCVLIMESYNYNKFTDGANEFWQNCGYTMVVEKPAYQFEDIEFCQTHPIKVEGGYRMVRNIDTAREKDSICLFPLTDKKTVEAWMYAVGECGLALCSGIPIMQSMYQAYMKHGRETKFSTSLQMQSGAKLMSIGMESKSVPITDESRDSFFQAFGYTPDEQVAMEEYYCNWSFNYKLNEVDELTDIHNAPL